MKTKFIKGALILVGFSILASAVGLPLKSFADKRPSNIDIIGKGLAGTGFLTDPAVIQELKDRIDWSKKHLSDLLSEMTYWDYSKARKNLTTELLDIDKQSAEYLTETLMRYSIRRGLSMAQVIEEDADPAQAGIIDQEVRSLWRSAQFANAYIYADESVFQSQMKTLDKLSNSRPRLSLPRAQFGLAYSKFCLSLGDSIFDASAMFKTAFMCAGWLQDDLKNDPLSELYATTQVQLAQLQEHHIRMYRKAEIDPDSISDTAYLLAMKDLRRDFNRAFASVPKEIPRWIPKGLSSGLQTLIDGSVYAQP